MPTKTLLSAFIAVIVLGLGAYVGHTTALKQNPHAHACTINRRAFDEGADGRATPVCDEVEYHDARGNVRTVRTERDIPTPIVMGIDEAAGVYSVSRQDPTQYEVTHRFAHPPLPTAEQLKAQPGFVRAEELFGMTAITIRPVVDTPGHEASELTTIPELDNVVVRIVTPLPGGGKHVIETTALTLGEPPADSARLPQGLKLGKDWTKGAGG